MLTFPLFLKQSAKSSICSPQRQNKLHKRTCVSHFETTTELLFLFFLPQKQKVQLKIFQNKTVQCFFLKKEPWCKNKKGFHVKLYRDFFKAWWLVRPTSHFKSEMDMWKNILLATHECKLTSGFTAEASDAESWTSTWFRSNSKALNRHPEEIIGGRKATNRAGELL